MRHIAIRRRLTVNAARADRLFTRLRAAQLDETLEAEFRRLMRIDLLIIDDFALRPLDSTTTSDLYELVVERQQRHSIIITGDTNMAIDTLLAQSAVDHLTTKRMPLSSMDHPTANDPPLTARIG